MKSFSQYKNKQSVPVFFGNLIGYRAQAHILHLGSKSFSEHKSLEEFYNLLNELIDNLIETYQGQYGLIQIKSNSLSYSSPSELLNDVVKEIKDFSKEVEEDDTHISNILDEILALTYRTIYKLNNLK